MKKIIIIHLKLKSSIKCRAVKAGVKCIVKNGVICICSVLVFIRDFVIESVLADASSSSSMSMWSSDGRI